MVQHIQEKEMDERAVCISITFLPEDVETLETALERHGRDLDQSGIIEHILSEINLKKDQTNTGERNEHRN